MEAPALDMMELADLAQPGKIALEIQKQLRSQYGSVPHKIPLEGIASAAGIVGIQEFDTNEFEGTLVISQGVGAIGLRRGLPRGRRNFTLAHEIGHFLVPNHRMVRPRFQCATHDMAKARKSNIPWDRRSAEDRIEVEANEFAAALLVPGPEYRAERKRLGSADDVSHIRALADTFAVSQEMMARVYVNGADEPLAIIISHKGVARRVIAHPDFPFMGLTSGTVLPNSALTPTFRKSKADGEVSDLREVLTNAWLQEKGKVTALYEQVMLQQNGWATTMLAVEQDEDDDEADDRNWNRRSHRH